MDALVLVLTVGAALLIAYVTIGRWVAGRVFLLREDTPTPATVLCDDRDYCPTPKSIVFGHHFTSIAGTGPIVGPAIAVMWGWLPAVLWVVFGSIFIGAVHDLGALVVSLRNKGRSVGDIAGDLLGPRVRLIFLAVLVMALWIVLAIFGLVIASVLRQYPGSIFPVLAQIPLAVVIGLAVHRKGRSIFVPSMLALALMYASVVWGDAGPLHAFNMALASAPMWAWVVGLLAYAYVASVLPVWTLLQPRDYINSLQLLSAIVLLVAGLVVAATIGGAPSERPAHYSITVLTPAASHGLGDADSHLPLVDGPGERDSGDSNNITTESGALRTGGTPVPLGGGGTRPKLQIVAPMVQWQPEGAPPMLPVLFITIACGAVSGFHCLVGSGTTSKQLRRETDARLVGYGSMLTEAFLATLVIAACAAGIGLGWTSLGVWEGSTGKLTVNDGTYFRVGEPASLIAFNSRPPYPMRLSGPYEPDASWGTWHSNTHMFSDNLWTDEETFSTTHGSIRANLPASEKLSKFRNILVIDVSGEIGWRVRYGSWRDAQGLAATVGAFVEGAANLVKALGVPASVAVALMGVLVASFAGTTMDTACRLQRYVVQELSRTFLPRPPSTACHRCGYDLAGLIADSPLLLGKGPGERDSGASSDITSELHSSRTGETPVPLSELDSRTGETPVPLGTPVPLSDARSPVTCPECGGVNRWHLETGSHPAERAPETLGLDAMVRHASVWNPFKWLATTHGATLFAVLTAVALAAVPAPGQPWNIANFGQGGLILWPLFGATNQLLGGLAFLVIGAWLIATKRPWWFIAPPAVFMLVIPAWAMVWQTFIGNDANPSWFSTGRWSLAGVAIITIALEVWLVAEVMIRALRSRGEARAIDAPC